MKRPSKEEYERAVALALASIEAHKSRPRTNSDRSPKALVAAMQKKQAKGEAPTKADLAALAAAMGEQESRKQRGRGRPKGTRDYASIGAFRAAVFAMEETDLSTYRNSATGHKMTKCDAIAEAMRAAGYRKIATYDAVAREMKEIRRAWRTITGGLKMQLRQFGEISQIFSEGLIKSLLPISQQMHGKIQTLAKHLKGIRIIDMLPPETQRAIEKHIKTRR